MFMLRVSVVVGCGFLPSTTERQIVASLDQLHREMVDSKPCQWSYDGGKDLYSCPHLALTGKVVIGRVQGFNHYSINMEVNNDSATDSTPAVS